jgi:hypothetical protein
MISSPRARWGSDARSPSPFGQGRDTPRTGQRARPWQTSRSRPVPAELEEQPQAVADRGEAPVVGVGIRGWAPGARRHHRPGRQDRRFQEVPEESAGRQLPPSTGVLPVPPRPARLGVERSEVERNPATAVRLKLHTYVGCWARASLDGWSRPRPGRLPRDRSWLSAAHRLAARLWRGRSGRGGVHRRSGAGLGHHLDAKEIQVRAIKRSHNGLKVAGGMVAVGGWWYPCRSVPARV